MVKKTVKKDQKRKAKKAAQRTRPIMSTRAGLDALSKGLQESFTRIANLDREFSEILDDLNTRLSRIESHLEIVLPAEEEASDGDDEVPE